MDDTSFGTRDRRGHWRPFKPVSYAPVFRWPFEPKVFAKWLFGHDGYMFPWNFFYAVIAVLFWLYLTPSMETMRTLSWDWPLFILLRNALTLFVVTGALHFILYIRRRQGTSFKYNAKWPSEGSSAFLFKSQNIDNMIWNFASGVPIWTAWEVGMLWAYANGYISFVSFEEHPIYLGLLFFLVPIWKNALHFYFIHRLLHVPSLYHLVHKVHHANNNPGPWTGLSMHPVEHLLFYSSVLLYVIVPAHPVIIIFELLQASLGPGVGHAGFAKIVIDDKRVRRYPRPPALPPPQIFRMQLRSRYRSARQVVRYLPRRIGRGGCSDEPPLHGALPRIC